MMKQYHEAKAAAGDALLLFRMGDFYELFFEDAKTAARVLGLSLTSRDKGDPSKGKVPIPMAGFPHHQLDGYLAKIIAAGMRAAVCEQVEDPKQAKGLVKREISRSSAAAPSPTTRCSTRPRATICSPSAPAKSGADWLDRHLHRAASSRRAAARQTGRRTRPNRPGRNPTARRGAGRSADRLDRGATCSRVDPIGRSVTIRQTAALAKQFGTHALDGFGFDRRRRPGSASCRCCARLSDETQKASLAHVDRLLPYRVGIKRLEIDEATRRSLELTHTLRDGRRDGFAAGRDRSHGHVDGRAAAGDWLANPLTDAAAINAGSTPSEELHNETSLAGELRDALRATYDMQRLLARVTTGRATPRDLSFVARTLAACPRSKPSSPAAAPADCSSSSRASICADDVRSQLEAALVDDCPLTSRDGGFIRTGFHADSTSSAS